jgi:hypothetical protein
LIGLGNFADPKRTVRAAITKKYLLPDEGGREGKGFFYEPKEANLVRLGHACFCRRP